jgi:hypothetical protein
MASWQLKGLLLLAAALVATALAATTSGAVPRPSLDPTVVRPSIAAAARASEGKTTVINRWQTRYDG